MRLTHRQICPEFRNPRVAILGATVAILRDLTRKNEKITQESLKNFIQTLGIKEEVKSELLNITPFTYTGIGL